jgi:hypothetical protein
MNKHISCQINWQEMCLFISTSHVYLTRNVFIHFYISCLFDRKRVFSFLHDKHRSSCPRQVKLCSGQKCFLSFFKNSIKINSSIWFGPVTTSHVYLTGNVFFSFLHLMFIWQEMCLFISTFLVYFTGNKTF